MDISVKRVNIMVLFRHLFSFDNPLVNEMRFKVLKCKKRFKRSKNEMGKPLSYGVSKVYVLLNFPNF